MSTTPPAPTPPATGPVPITEVKFPELIRRELAGLGKAIDPDKLIAPELLRHDLFGLALSGGGIRSATFGLGVIQRLAQLGLLRRLDFLSTVSGGGYLGSWLAAWIQRQNGGIKEVEKLLVPRPQEHAEPEEAAPIHWLRRYGKYLAPKSALFSADTWTIVAIWMRNTMLNLVVLTMFLMAVMSIPWVITVSYQAFSGTGAAAKISALHVTLAILAAVCAAVGSRFPKSNASRILGILAALLICTSSVLHVYGPGDAGIFSLMIWGASLSIICLVGMVDWDASRRWRILARALLGISLGAAGMAAAPYYVLEPLERGAGFLAPIVIPPLISFLYCIQLTFLMGIQGRYVTDERREWWSRVGALIFIIGAVWLLLSGVVLIGPSIIDFLKLRFYLGIATGSLWAAATAAGVFLGHSSSTSGTGTTKSPIKETILPFLPIIFLAGLLMLLASGLSHIVLDRQAIPNLEPIVCQDCPQTTVSPDLGKTWDHVWVRFRQDILKKHSNPGLPLILLSLFAIGYYIFGRLIDINEFSMHRFYCNRLVRGFQGASRGEDRKPDHFTNLDAEDDLAITKLQRENGYTGPVHLVNTAINLNLAETGLDERRAGSFVFTPYGCGYSVGGEHQGHCQVYPDNCDLRLGTPVTASGAAASPNMGYHTSTPVAFLLTVFNVRLGYWIRNPKEKRGFSPSRRLIEKGYDSKQLAEIAAWSPTGPRNGQVYFISELFGLASDERKYVYLSDGGHFENLAVYELLRRRCRYIICVDGEQDENMQFEGLAGLVRRARSDMGVEIRIETADIEQRSAEGWSRAHCAVGRVVYPEDGANGKKIEGRLLYLKLSVTGDEPVDIINYRKANPAFPHQTTGDQFFDESQFESYRRLGFHVADHTFRSVPPALFQTTGGLNLQQIYQELFETWYGMPRSVTANFTKHTETLDGLLNELQTEDKLQILHAGLNQGWPAAMASAAAMPANREEYRACFYFCQRLIQLMENVYMDLDLEENFGHPSCSGWMEQFRDWTRAPMLKETYDKTKHTFSVKFVSFFARHFV